MYHVVDGIASNANNTSAPAPKVISTLQITRNKQNEWVSERLHAQEGKNNDFQTESDTKWQNLSKYKKD
jgi:hypothetical protein